MPVNNMRILSINVIACAAFLIACSDANAQATSGPITADGGFTSTPVRECQSDLRYFNHLSGWQAGWPARWEAIVAGDGDDLQGAIELWSTAPHALEELRNALQRGIENDETASRVVVARVYQQVRDLSGSLGAEDPRYYFAKDPAAVDTARWNQQMTELIAPAIESFAAYLQKTYLPAANPVPGLAGMKDGAACFKHAAAWWTTLDLTPEEIERAGTRLLNETRAELLETALSGEDFDDVIARLRTRQAHDETTQAQIMEISEAAIARAMERADEVFTMPSLNGVVVEALPAHLQASSPAGFYRAEQNGRSAAYILNPSRPGERRLMAEAIAFHETVPGHHLFFEYPRDPSEYPFNAGIVEGWAIYAEYLADEMQLYSSALDRQGMIAKHLWAASRLVVEPGLHLRGWSRDEAIDFMSENTALSRTEIEIEVDRYLALPGQSLSYMLGADLILNERRCAKKTLGDGFDIREFHDVVLAAGVRPLPIVQHDIRAWVASRAPATVLRPAHCERAPPE